jgi:hypothetical protein
MTTAANRAGQWSHGNNVERDFSTLVDIADRQRYRFFARRALNPEISHSNLGGLGCRHQDSALMAWLAV